MSSGNSTMADTTVSGLTTNSYWTSEARPPEGDAMEVKAAEAMVAVDMEEEETPTDPGA